MSWIKTLDDLSELDSGRNLPDEMMEQMRGLLEGMHATYGGSEELEDFVLGWETGGPMAFLAAEDFGPEGCLVTGELGLDRGRRLSENGAEFVEEHRPNDGKRFFRLAYVLDNDTCLTIFVTGRAPDPETKD